MRDASRRLALDHLTVVDTTPSQLVEVAAQTGCAAVCLFLQPMAVLPRMPAFALIGDTTERRATRARCAALGIGIDVAYPFTLASRTDLASFDLSFETAAYLGVRAVNALVYDRDPGRRAGQFARFCERAAAFGLDVVVEFYPSSQVRSLGEAIDLIRAAGAPSRAGINVDLLHLMRSGGSVEELAAAPPELVTYGQFCDGAPSVDPTRREWEASSQRLLPGEGCFDIAGFAAALPDHARVSVELPQERSLVRGDPSEQRARKAVEAVRSLLARPPGQG